MLATISRPTLGLSTRSGGPGTYQPHRVVLVSVPGQSNIEKKNVSIDIGNVRSNRINKKKTRLNTTSKVIFDRSSPLHNEQYCASCISTYLHMLVQLFRVKQPLRDDVIPGQRPRRA